MRAIPSVKDSLVMEIAERQEKAHEARTGRDTWNNKVTELVKKRTILNEQVKTLLETAREEKENRDKENDKISATKKKKEELEEKIKDLSIKLEEKEKDIEATDEQNYHRQRLSAKNLNKQIRDLEWTLQTTGNISLEDERVLVDQIDEIEVKLQGVRAANEKFRELHSLSRELDSFQRQFDRITRDLKELSRESHLHHRTMIQCFKQADILRKDADDTHKEFLIAKTQANEFHRNYIDSMKSIGKLSSEIDKARKMVRAQKESEVREKLEEKTDDAFDKFKSGKKLNFEEFQTLVNKGLI